MQAHRPVSLFQQPSVKRDYLKRNDGLKNWWALRVPGHHLHQKKYRNFHPLCTKPGLSHWGPEKPVMPCARLNHQRKIPKSEIFQGQKPHSDYFPLYIALQQLSLPLSTLLHLRLSLFLSFLHPFRSVRPIYSGATRDRLAWTLVLHAALSTACDNVPSPLFIG